MKRKNVKRAFKSEKEFLEFTLKYQQVLAERDSGNSLSLLPCAFDGFFSKLQIFYEIFDSSCLELSNLFI